MAAGGRASQIDIFVGWQLYNVIQSNLALKSEHFSYRRLSIWRCDYLYFTWTK